MASSGSVRPGQQEGASSGRQDRVWPPGLRVRREAEERLGLVAGTSVRTDPFRLDEGRARPQSSSPRRRPRVSVLWMPRRPLGPAGLRSPPRTWVSAAACVGRQVRSGEREAGRFPQHSRHDASSKGLRVRASGERPASAREASVPRRRVYAHETLDPGPRTLLTPASHGRGTFAPAAPRPGAAAPAPPHPTPCAPPPALAPRAPLPAPTPSNSPEAACRAGATSQACV